MEDAPYPGTNPARTFFPAVFPLGSPMPLSDAMQKELDRRLDLAEREHANDGDPAFVDLPRADTLWLLVLFVGCLIGTAILQVL
jgi:hypothetical protein